MRGVPRADDGHGQRIARLKFPAHEQHAGRIGQIQQRRRIAFDAFRENVDAGRTTAFDLRFGVNFLVRAGNRPAQFRAYPGNRAQIGRRGASTASGVPNCSSSLQRIRGPTPETIDNRTVAAKDAASTDVPKLPDIRSPFDGANPIRQCPKNPCQQNGHIVAAQTVLRSKAARKRDVVRTELKKPQFSN